MTILIVDCVWSDWQNGKCSVTCGGGTRTNNRSKLVVEKNGGVCVGESTKQENCNEMKCPGMIVLHLVYSMYYIAF